MRHRQPPSEARVGIERQRAQHLDALLVCPDRLEEIDVVAEAGGRIAPVQQAGGEAIGQQWMGITGS